MENPSSGSWMHGTRDIGDRHRRAVVMSEGRGVKYYNLAIDSVVIEMLKLLFFIWFIEWIVQICYTHIVPMNINYDNIKVHWFIGYW